jgi:hypothetical protein
MYCRVVKRMSTDVSEVHAASIIRAISEPRAHLPLGWEVKREGPVS